MWQSWGVDSLAFATTHEPEWARLAELSAKTRLTGTEADELVRLYQRAASDLATVRTSAPNPDLTLHLSALLGRARSRLTGSRGGNLNAVANFLFVTLPVAFHRIRWWTLGVALAFIGVFLVVLFNIRQNPDILRSMGTEMQLKNYAEVLFPTYYTEHGSSEFTTIVWTNNAWIALQCVGGGITGVYPAWVLWQNAIGIGESAAILDNFGQLGTFFEFILPHGLLELTAIFIAGAAGFKLFWTALVPGPRTRLSALASEGRQTIMVGVGLIGVLFVSGLIEGFVTGSSLPSAVKIAIGAAALSGFWAWVWYFNRRAVANNLSADLSADDAGWTIEYSG